RARRATRLLPCRSGHAWRHAAGRRTGTGKGTARERAAGFTAAMGDVGPATAAPGSVAGGRERTVRGYRKAGHVRPEIRSDVLLHAVAAHFHRPGIAEHDRAHFAAAVAPDFAFLQQRLLDHAAAGSAHLDPAFTR